MIALDHIAVAGETLADATTYVEETLGVSLEPGGVHVEMGTHNRLLSLGPGIYLEAIAINPQAASPDRPRWFNLDLFSGRPRVTNWIARTDDLAAALLDAPSGMGVPIPFSRGDFFWSMAVPGNGRLPFDGAAPALITWETARHPADLLPDAGCRLIRLEVGHPKIGEMLNKFPRLSPIPNVEFLQTDAFSLRARIETPSGVKVLT